jgi:hypothetical protein
MLPADLFEFPHYSLDQAQYLLGEFNSLAGFADAKAWDAAAEGEAARLQQQLAVLDDYELRLSTLEHRSEAEHQGKGFFSKLFSSPEHRDSIASARARVANTRPRLDALAKELESNTDRTPDSPEEQKAMLKDLKLLKKELNQHKKELNAEMRDIRTAARQASAKIGAGWDLVFSTPTSRRIERMSLRLNKETALAPHEDRKALLERQILFIDRTILWVERFK